VTIAFYDVSVASFLQTTKAVARVLDKARAHFEQQGSDLQDIVGARIYDDMLPFRFQIASVAQHSLGAIEALDKGLFLPPRAPESLDYPALQDLMARTVAGLGELDADAVNALEDRELIFRLGQMELPFVARDFILSFSLPNFYFHATTAYDILRMKGVPLGKVDFMGRVRIKR